MFDAKFRIVARRKDSGEWFECFRWTRDAETGIERAKSDAEQFGIECSEFAALPIHKGHSVWQAA